MAAGSEARDLQQAIQNSYPRPDSRSRPTTSTFQPVASTSKTTLDDRPNKRVKKEEGKLRAKFNDDVDIPLDLQQLRRDAVGLSHESEFAKRNQVLREALGDYSQFGSPNRKLGANLKPPPQAERWDEGLDRFRRGALRMTRTPGRRRSRQANCISLDDLIRPQAMLGMFSTTFLLEFNFLAPLLPILESSHSRRPVPILLAQPLLPDPLLSLACSQTGIAPPTQERRHLKVAEAQKVTPLLSKIYQEVVGRNLIAIHPKCQGCSHSKIFVVRYTGFLLVVITSANTMALDMELCDNHWYIQAFPELTPHQLKQRKSRNQPPTEFEQILLYHLNELECPSDFLCLLSNYDYSLASDIHLVVSQPGVVSPNDFHLRSIGRLGNLARDLIKDKERDRIKFEVCCGSVGGVKEEWMESVDWLLRGKDPKVLEERLKKRLLSKESKEAEGINDDEEKTLNYRRKNKKKRKGKSRANSEEEDDEMQQDDSEEEEQDWKIIYPPKEYVDTLSEEVRNTASNISSFWKLENWSEAPTEVKRLFFQYRSKEPGRLFHEKSILWLNSSSPRSTPPLLFYLGSHNFSAAAWGSPAVYGSKSKKTGLKTEGIGNYEIGIVIKGEKIVEMLEKGSKWEDIVTYKRPVERFGENDIPWVSSAWAKKLKQGENDQVGDE